MRRVAFDTNLLVLLIVGQLGPGLIARHKRLRGYNDTDFRLLVEILEQATELITTSQCLAEVSNLAVQGVVDPLRSEILLGLKAFVASAVERSIASVSAVAQEEYLRLGVTDAAWLAAIERNVTLVTADTDLYLAALNRGQDAVRFSDLRI